MEAKYESIARRVIAGEADAKKLETLFAGLRFADPAKAAALWLRLVPAGGADAPPAANIANLLAEIASSPDPDAAILNLSRFVESRIAPARFLHSLFLARPIARLFVTIFSCSYFLTEILERNPGYLSWLVEAGTLEDPKSFSAYRFELGRQIEPFRDPRRRLNGVKRYFRREMLRIGARDLMGLAGVEEVTAELSFLADAIIETVACMAFEELAESAGPGATAWSFDTAVPYHRFAIVSLGKLGGTELNYSSDIDLMYVCEATEGERERAFYDALARRVTEYLSSPTEEGTLYRVDLRLRPDGGSGPLVVTLGDHVNYLQRRAKPWELQSLIKARHSAGNRPVGDAFVENCAKAIYPPAPSFDPLDEIVTMRERWITYLPEEERAGNIKLMAGGIRDIEFIAQGIQLLHGRGRPDIRSRNTLESLERLARHGLLGTEAKETLERSYRLFRTVEHRMQMLRNVRTHMIPGAGDDLAKTAERVCRSALRGVTSENFTAELGRSIGEVQHIFDGYFRNRVPGEIPLLLSLPAGDRAVEDILAKYGFREGEEAHRFLSALVFGDFPRLEGIETLAAAARSLPAVLDRVALTPDPSLALKNFVRIVKATGAVKSTLELIAGGGDLLRLLLTVASLSTKLSETLAGRIELLDSLAEGAPPEAPAPRPAGDEFLPSLARRHEEALLFIHIQHPIPENGPEVLGPLLTGASERALVSLFDAGRENGARGAGPDGLALFALGSLAKRSARFGSDLDLIAVASDERSADAGAAAVRGVIDGARAIRLGPVDMRLRGEGASAPLVQTFDYCEGYLRSRVSLWEILAYSKCRFVCGDEATGRSFEAMLARELPVIFGREGWKERLLDSRAKLEALSKSPWDVKHAAGGLYDIDFLLCAARLRGIVRAAPSPDPRPALEELRSAGILEASGVETLAAAHRLFWTMEHAAALHGFAYPPLPEREEFFERYFLRLLGAQVPGAGTFLARLTASKRNIRAVFERFARHIE